MAEIILTNVLNKKISIDELFKWLTSDNLEETISSDIVQSGTTRTDFISYFLNYLREQCKSVLPEIKEIQEKTNKKTTPDEISKVNNKQFMHKDPTDALLRNKNEYSNDCKPPDKEQANHQLEILPSTSFISLSSQGFSAAYISPRLPEASNFRSPVQSSHFPPLPYQRNAGSPLANNTMHQFPSPTNFQRNCHPSNSNLMQNQLQGNWNHGNIPKCPIQPMSPGQYYNNDIHGYHPTGSSSPNVDSSLNAIDLNQTRSKIENLNVSPSHGKFEASFSNVSLDSRSPQKFENSSMMNGSSFVNSPMVTFSPVSPLYANNASILCPQKIQKSQNDTHCSHDNSNRNISKTSTPKSASTGSGQKITKSGQNQNFCLGDFMISDIKSSDKMSKKQLRMHNWKQSQTEKKIKFAEKNNEISSKNQPQSETKSKRRIKPTRLNVSNDEENRGKEVFGVISRPKTANPKFVEAPSTDKSQEELSFEVERGLLKLERQRQPKNDMANEIVNNEKKLANKSKTESTIVPNLDLVENAETLDILTSIYSGILDHNLMLNPMTELYFLMTLLITQYKEKKHPIKMTESSLSSSIKMFNMITDDLGCSVLSDEIVGEINDEGSAICDEKLKEESFNENSRESSNTEDSIDNLTQSIDKDKKLTTKYLDTAHNCVYFASAVMMNQRHLLSILDRVTLKLLCENQQISTFQPELQKYFNDIYSVKCLQTNRLKQTESGNLQTNVCFQLDTDNCEAFPSPVAFTLFRKQRDMFYDILKDWEDNHLKPNWSYQRALKSKINALFAFHTDTVNYCHLAKLFISQLLVSSGQSGKMEDPMNDESLSFLKSLKHLNPEKLLQLKGRLVTPLTSTGPVPQSIFPGVQEFYKKFILNALNWKFYVILENTLISEIMELNETQFARSEIESAETTVDEITKQNFITCVSSLRLLAKFTTFTTSLPFRSTANSPEWIISQIQLRGRVLPSLDLHSCVLDALKNRRLSLTIPWIVQYMAMLDPVTFRLPYYVNIGELLYCIYRISNNRNLLEGNDLLMSHQTSMLMIFTIGWLFELPNFPRDLYAQWQINYNEKKLRMLENDPREKYRNINSIVNESSKEFVKYNTTLDELNLIDDRALYECCPFLAEFKVLLISGNSILGNSNANRHITPVSSQLSQPGFTVKTKNLQMQLEEAFFHGQPGSIRKTVDFVSERVASSYVKYICNVIIPELKQNIMKAYIKSKNGKIDLLLKYEEDDDKFDTSPNKSPTKSHRKAQAELTKHQMQALATTIKDSVKRECLQKMPDMCEMKTIKSIESLLSDDAFPSVKETCISIARRMVIERVEEWINSHIVESLFLRNMNLELKKLLKEEDQDQTDKGNYHNTKVPCPTEVIGMIRNSMWELLEKKNQWMKLSSDGIIETLNCVHQVLTERADLVEYPRKNIFMMSVEFCLLLITHRHDLFTSVIQDTFLNIWKMNNSHVGDNESLFVRIISPRNIRLLTSTSNSSVMKIFGGLLKGLLKNDLLNIEELSEQCVALFRQEWPEPILKQLSQCLKDVVADYKCSGDHAEGTKYLLRWIAMTCDEMEMYD